jgi:hypothetical protein
VFCIHTKKFIDKFHETVEPEPHYCGAIGRNVKNGMLQKETAKFRSQLYELMEFNAAGEVPFCGAVRLRPQIRNFVPQEGKRMRHFMTLYAVNFCFFRAELRKRWSGCKEANPQGKSRSRA